MSDPKSQAILKYSVVVPVFNEAAVIPEFCARARAELPDGYEVLICYDHDSDTTLSALESIPADRKPLNVRLIKNTLGPGVRYAIEAGMRAAQAPVVVVMMSDGSDDFSRVGEMVQIANDGADVVCASRYMRGGAQIGGPRLKKLLSRTAGVSLHWLTGLPTRDPTNSFKAYRREFLDATPIESTAGFCLGLELTAKAHVAGGRVTEVPATWLDRTAGQSRFKLWKWLPLYLHWYSWAVDRSRRANLLAVSLLLLIALALGLSSILLRSDLHFTSSYVLGEHGNELYRASRLVGGALLYRDVACQYGPIPVYLHSLAGRIAGVSIATNLGFHLAASLACIAIAYLVLRKSFGVGYALAMMLLTGVPLLLAPGGATGGYTNVEYLSFDRLCMLSILLLWRVPAQRTLGQSASIGAVLGVWQGVKFGGPAFAIAALAVTDLMVIGVWHERRVLVRYWLTALVSFVLLELVWIAVAYGLFPASIAFDTVFPAYVAGSYPGLDAPNRFPEWVGLGFFLGQQLMPLVCIALGFVVLAAVMLRRRAMGLAERAATNQRLYLFAGPVFFFLALPFYLRHVHLVYHWIWVFIFVGAWGLSILPSLRLRLVAGIVLLPSLLLMLKITFVNSPDPRTAWYDLPTRERVACAESEREQLRCVEEVARDHARNGEFIVAALKWGGGGVPHYFDPAFDLRNYLIAPHAVRPYDDAELAVKLSRVGAFILVVHDLSQAAVEQELRSFFSRELVDRILGEYQFDRTRSVHGLAVLVRRG